MKGARPKQIILSRVTNVSKTFKSPAIVAGMLGFLHVLTQLSTAVSKGKGWEAFDRGEMKVSTP
jgi:hypothetical protein